MESCCYICIPVHILVCGVCVCVCMFMCMHIYVHICMNVCVCVCLCMLVCGCIWVCTRTLSCLCVGNVNKYFLDIVLTTSIVNRNIKRFVMLVWCWLLTLLRGVFQPTVDATSACSHLDSSHSSCISPLARHQCHSPRVGLGVTCRLHFGRMTRVFYVPLR